MDAVPLDDRGLLLGDGLFETLLCKAGALVLAQEHAARMAAGAGELGLPAPPAAAFVKVALDAVRAAGLEGERAAVRVTLTAGSGGRGLERPDPPQPRLFAAAAAAAPPLGPASLTLADVRRNAASPASRLKTLAYLDSVIARRQARALGADEAVMLNTDGVLASAAAANLFWIRGETLYAPPLSAGRLDGLMARHAVAAAARLGVRTAQVLEGPHALASADAVFLTNSLIGVRCARMLGQPGAPHPLVQRLAEAVGAFC